MRVAGLDTNGDWVFGRGIFSYLKDSSAIRQNVVTRLRSFTNDWFLDVNHGSPWLDLMGTRNNIDAIKREVAKNVLNTTGIKAITSLVVDYSIKTRNLTINLVCVDVYNLEIVETVVI